MSTKEDMDQLFYAERREVAKDAINTLTDPSAPDDDVEAATQYIEDLADAVNYWQARCEALLPLREVQQPRKEPALTTKEELDAINTLMDPGASVEDREAAIPFIGDLTHFANWMRRFKALQREVQQPPNEKETAHRGDAP